MNCYMENKQCIIRLNGEHVFFGTITKKEKSALGCECTIKDCRRIWSWDSDATLEQLAVDGVSKPEECMFSAIEAEKTFMGKTEIIPASEKAIKSIEAVPARKGFMRIDLSDLDLFKEVIQEVYFHSDFNRLEIRFVSFIPTIIKAILEIRNYLGNQEVIKLVKLYVRDHETNDFVLKRAWSDIYEWEHPLPEEFLKNTYPDFFNNHHDLITYNLDELFKSIDSVIEEWSRKEIAEGEDLPL